MIIKFNKKFEGLKGLLALSEGINDKTLTFPFNERPFEYQGCYFMSRKREYGFSPDLFDETGSEIFYNRRYVNDYLDDDVKPIDCFHLGVKWAYLLTKKMKTSIKRPISVVLSYDLKNTTWLSFHVVREGQNYVSENIEGYREDAVLQIID